MLLLIDRRVIKLGLCRRQEEQYHGIYRLGCPRHLGPSLWLEASKNDAALENIIEREKERERECQKQTFHQKRWSLSLSACKYFIYVFVIACEGYKKELERWRSPSCHLNVTTSSFHACVYSSICILLSLASKTTPKAAPFRKCTQMPGHETLMLAFK